MTNTGYYTSRHQIINWVNDLLITSVNKIEQLGSGSIYCHILDAAYPSKVPLNKVKWGAYLEIDFLHNYKILQTSFERLGITKHIDIQRLSKAKYQDNLEFIQWMKWYFEPKIKENCYNALTRRNNAQINLSFSDKKVFDIKQTLTRDTKETKSMFVQSISTIISPRTSKVTKFNNENQTYRTLVKGQSIKFPTDTHEISKISSSCTVAKPILKYKKKMETIDQKNQPLHDKTNLPNVQIIESEEQECF